MVRKKAGIGAEGSGCGSGTRSVWSCGAPTSAASGSGGGRRSRPARAGGRTGRGTPPGAGWPRDRARRRVPPRPVARPEGRRRRRPHRTCGGTALPRGAAPPERRPVRPSRRRQRHELPVDARGVRAPPGDGPARRGPAPRGVDPEAGIPADVTVGRGKRRRYSIGALFLLLHQLPR